MSELVSNKLLPSHLSRRAVVYIRQSSQYQVQHNTESTRRQYDLVAHANSLGFMDVETIDEDLGRSGGGKIDRPGFTRLVTMVCNGEVGAVFALEASRLARNGRDWHQLIELCGFTGALVVDIEGVYDPRFSNDRLLLGLKGTMSEFELSLFRQRSEQAIRQKAQRGELKFLLPIGYLWTSTGELERDPDRRIFAAVASVFAKFEELGSARQVLLWFCSNGILLPAVHNGTGARRVEWKAPCYHAILAILRNPLYAGTYAYGKTEVRLAMNGMRAERSEGHRKPRERWIALLHDHHEAYISWQQFERNEAIIARNTHMRGKMGPTGGRGGRSLLAGMLRCRRCGRMLHVAYSGVKGNVPRYSCQGGNVNHGAPRCISFGGLRFDDMISRELLNAVAPEAIAAAVRAAEISSHGDQTRTEALQLELDAARYQAQLAERRYEASDPENRLVTAELESRWNAALTRVTEAMQSMDAVAQTVSQTPPDREALMKLATALPQVWNLPTTPMRTKQRIAQILLTEIIVDLDATRNEVVAFLHWRGGRHSELRIHRNKRGERAIITAQDAVAIIETLAGRFPDETIASTLNRLRLRTGANNTWNEDRVKSVRQRKQLANYDPAKRDQSLLTLDQAAERLSLSPSSVKQLISRNIITGEQLVLCAPWLIPAEQLTTSEVKRAAKSIKDRRKIPRSDNANQTNLDLTSNSSGGA
jgi:DNA invertase Pin-like site-specific DNA recombinase